MMNRNELANKARSNRGSHTHGGHSSAAAGWTCGDTLINAEPSKSSVLGRFKVNAPTKRHHRRGFYRSAS